MFLNSFFLFREAKKKEKLGLLTIVDKLNKENEAMQRKKLVNPQLFTDAVTERAKVEESVRKINLCFLVSYVMLCNIKLCNITLCNISLCNIMLCNIIICTIIL